MRTLKLYSLAKGFILLFVIAALLTVFHQYTYSNVPLFSQYLIKILLEQPGISGLEPINEVNLPRFLINYFEEASQVMDVVIRIALALLVLQIFRFSFRLIEMWLKGLIKEKLSEKLRIDLYSHIQTLSYGYHNKADSGDMIQRVTSDVDTTTNFLTETNFSLVHLFSTLVFGAYQVYMINPTMVWVCLVLVPFVGIASIFYFKKVDRVFQEIEETESKMMTVIQENLSGARVVRAFANEAYEVQKMEDKNIDFTAAQKKAMRMVSVYWGVMDFIAFTQYLVVISIGIYFVRNQQMDAAAMVAALALVGLLIWPIRGLGRIINDYGKALVASERIHELFNQPSEYVNDGTQTPEIKGHIVFDHVSFKFDDTEDQLIKDVSFEIKAGQTVAIIGRTGSGKTTVINLLLRMYDYQQGDIIIDGVSLKDIQKKHMRTHIGTVLQDPFLYSKTVFENIAIAQKNVEEQRVYQAAQTAALEKDIKTFKQGYETLVGEKGTTLSGGQKQRVAIARILVADKPILIFDDALSAVDTKTDMMIRDALLKRDQKQTTIIITHRITTAKEADQIIVLEQGKIEAIGTHQTLSKQAGLYKKLWDIQGKLEKEFEAVLKAGDSNA